MFNMGFSEMLVLGVIALIVIGPKQLPELAKILARTINEFKRATGDLTSSFYSVKKEAEDYFNEAGEYMNRQKDEFQKKLEDSMLEEEHSDHDHDHDHDHESNHKKSGDSES